MVLRALVADYPRPPPAIERGEELHVPDVLEKPDTGVTIAVPPTYADLYRVAPLAFYLGADVVPGEEAELRLDLGYTEPLRRPGRTLEESVDRLLARCLLLDSLVRVGGYYSFPRYEYDEVAPHLPFYPPELYERSVGEQLVEYLEVPFDVLEPHVPKWTTTAVLRPRLEDAAVVPPLLDSLSRVHVATGADASAEPGRTLDTAVTAYAGRTPPVGETRLVPAAFENLRGREQSVPAECRFDFFGVGQAAVDAYDRVCNAVDTGHEDGVPTRRRRTRPTREVLRRALGASEFLHFGGDVTDEGFVCADGVLPWADLGSVETTVVSIAGGAGGDGVDAAVSLVESGAAAAVVFDGAVPDETVGRLPATSGRRSRWRGRRNSRRTTRHTASSATRLGPSPVGAAGRPPRCSTSPPSGRTGTD
ncbi:hypothetical protein [Halospeciosus flavus]|uniref:hypothetical protein n=1 Tax=Halospeciosus flavus TaxID=3032283 RepID=UPI00361BAB72